ncbi:MAG: hypothetical protein K1000chlam2_00132 [Chlamydiae bacterium]|nr:hypothetical protein [Chlamydiota bacterium]
MPIAPINSRQVQLAGPQQTGCIHQITSAALWLIKAPFHCFYASAQWVWQKAYQALIGSGPGAQYPSSGSAYSNTDMINVMNQTTSVLKEGKYDYKGKIVDFLQAAKDATKSTEKQDAIYTRASQINVGSNRTQFAVIRKDAVEVAIDLKKQGYNPALLNPANAFTPGGSYKTGARAMEEDLCRRSSLSLAIDSRNEEQTQNFYPLKHSALLYSRDIPFIRHGRDGNYSYLPQPERISVITSAAIDLRHDKSPYSNDHPEFIAETTRRVYAQLLCATNKGHDCVVLTAFGCGAFKNKPEEVAKIYKEVIDTKFKEIFKNITFAIIEDHNSKKEHNPNGNVKPFRDVFGS